MGGGQMGGMGGMPGGNLGMFLPLLMSLSQMGGGQMGGGQISGGQMGGGGAPGGGLPQPGQPTPAMGGAQDFWQPGVKTFQPGQIIGGGVIPGMPGPTSVMDIIRGLMGGRQGGMMGRFGSMTGPTMPAPGGQQAPPPLPAPAVGAMEKESGMERSFEREARGF